MNIKNHFIFMLFLFFIVIFLDVLKLNLINIFYFFIGSLLTFSLPDIDHTKSFIGKKIYYISFFINKIFGHRGFIHSLFFIFFLNLILKNIFNYINFVPISIYHGMIFGYITHIVADLFTPMGIKLLWPLNLKFKINLINIFKKILIILIIMFLFNYFDIYKIWRY